MDIEFVFWVYWSRGLTMWCIIDKEEGFLGLRWSIYCQIIECVLHLKGWY